MRTSVAALLLTACAPRLYTSTEAEAWTPPENTWPVSLPPEDLVGQGFDEGSVALDARGDDQFGDEVSLWQFYGSWILLDISTMWCGPCQDLARGTEELYQEFRDDGVMHVTLLHENEAKEKVTEEELNIWAEFPSFHEDPAHPYDRITAPLVSDFNGRSGSITAVRNGQYPVALLIGPDMVVVDRIEPVTDARIHEVIASYVK